MKQIRLNVFETNSSSTHTFTCVYKSKVCQTPEEAFDGLEKYEVDLGIQPDELGDLDFETKMSLIFTNIPSICKGEVDFTLELKDYLADETVQKLVKYFKDEYDIEIVFKPYRNDPNLISGEKLYSHYHEEYILDKDFYKNFEKVIDFIKCPHYKIAGEDYYDG